MPFLQLWPRKTEHNDNGDQWQGYAKISTEKRGSHRKLELRDIEYSL